ncbi:PHYTOCHROME [Salix purpurea]|uniref:PHYTOCHROME n=1 Tax=Salix purpurea TaxID=77065 RepID=A0A9Q0SQA6_SALPP|nr:PHYTOCHROME [Salix purpurea]
MDSQLGTRGKHLQRFHFRASLYKQINPFPTQNPALHGVMNQRRKLQQLIFNHLAWAVGSVKPMTELVNLSLTLPLAQFTKMKSRIDVGIVIDLEPARTEDPALSIAGAVQSQKLAVRAISQLQSLPGGDIKLLCDTVVDSVRELTGYDRVMFYKFHEDEHGEVIAENKRDDLEPYIDLHYPSMDIPQASRFLLTQNRVRMIVDCHAIPVRVIQDEGLMKPLCLVGSTLRAPHGCHAQYMENMGTIASLAMAVIIHGNDEEVIDGRNSMRLWGLVVCHHTSSRCIPFPLRYACEFLIQAFGLQLNMELQLASQLLEKHVLRMHLRSSFKAFLEVVKSRSLPWENAEMDAIHSLAS